LPKWDRVIKFRGRNLFVGEEGVMELHLKTSIRILLFVYMFCSSSDSILSFESLPSATLNLFNSLSIVKFSYFCFATPLDGREQTLVSWYMLFHVLAFERPISVTWFRIGELLLCHFVRFLCSLSVWRLAVFGQLLIDITKSILICLRMVTYRCIRFSICY